ncbi:MAG TPA: hypothetical protein VNM43_09050 [Dehalococcoidia bacterium]|nr:hypothetical protein [Dehalococcoidia bacterium]
MRRHFPAVVALAAFLVAACGDEAADQTTPTPALSPGVTVTAVTQPPIFDVDFATAPDVASFLERAGGEVAQDAVIFADLTGDGEEEAVVPVSSGGTAGDIAYFVYTMRNGELELLLSVVPEAGRIQVELDAEGRLMDREPVYGPDDPECCPSRVRTRVYEWDGKRLRVASEREEPSSGVKTPSSE